MTIDPLKPRKTWLGVTGGFLVVLPLVGWAITGPSSPPPDPAPAKQLAASVTRDLRKALFDLQKQPGGWERLLELHDTNQIQTTLLREEFLRSREQGGWRKRESGSITPHTLRESAHPLSLIPRPTGALHFHFRRTSSPRQIQVDTLALANNLALHETSEILEVGDSNYRTSGAIHASGTILADSGASLPPLSAVAAEGGLLRCEPDHGVTFLPSDADLPPTPEVQPRDLSGAANFILDYEGQIRTADGTPVADLSNGGDWHGLSWSRTQGWVLVDGSPLPAAVYLIQGPLSVTALGRRTEEEVTFLVTGTVRLEGNVRLRPRMAGTLLVCGGDLIVRGTSSFRLQGLIAVREQVLLGGQGRIEGTLLVSDSEDGHFDVRRERRSAHLVSTRISGAFEVHFPGPFSTSIPDPFQAIRPVRPETTGTRAPESNIQ